MTAFRMFVVSAPVVSGEVGRHHRHGCLLLRPTLLALVAGMAAARRLFAHRVILPRLQTAECPGCCCPASRSANVRNTRLCIEHHVQLASIEPVVDVPVLAVADYCTRPAESSS